MVGGLFVFFTHSAVTHCSSPTVHAAVGDDFGQRNDPVVDFVSSSSLHWQDRDQVQGEAHAFYFTK